jgi:hypothetical protein
MLRPAIVLGETDATARAVVCADDFGSDGETGRPRDRGRSMLRPYGIAAVAQASMLDGADYEGPVGLLTKVIAGRLGSGLGTFFFGFLTSRFPLSLFPMPYSMPQFCNFATVARVRIPA